MTFCEAARILDKKDLAIARSHGRIPECFNDRDWGNIWFYDTLTYGGFFTAEAQAAFERKEGAEALREFEYKVKRFIETKAHTLTLKQRQNILDYLQFIDEQNV